ncbi:hypothetical protein RUM44_012337 [Polyplax serrata]|uniref:Uncharacterized protein n=1 Tax=Polyplax serrata TaxID=468196 RepID=A0ABR1BES4_POLSC
MERPTNITVPQKRFQGSSNKKNNKTGGGGLITTISVVPLRIVNKTGRVVMKTRSDERRKTNDKLRKGRFYVFSGVDVKFEISKVKQVNWEKVSPGGGRGGVYGGSGRAEEEEEELQRKKVEKERKQIAVW